MSTKSFAEAEGIIAANPCSDCAFPKVDAIKTVRDLENLFRSHEWEIKRKDGISDYGMQFQLKCRRCDARQVITLASLFLSKE